MRGKSKGKGQKSKGKSAVSLRDGSRSGIGSRRPALFTARPHVAARAARVGSHFCLLTLDLCLLTCFSSGCDRLSPYAATEHAIRRSLTERIGPAQAYSVRISHSGARLL